jgi:endonuclease YncB( thermonuclease family)
MRARTALLSLALCFVAAAPCFAQATEMGTWKLNEAKSKIPAGAAKNSTVVYVADGDNIKVTTDGTIDGKATHSEWTGKFDGKDYPASGLSAGDTRSYKRINDHSLSMDIKAGGKVTSSGKIVVSADGKTRTVDLKVTDSAGKKVSSVAVYDKQ